MVLPVAELDEDGAKIIGVELALLGLYHLDASPCLASVIIFEQVRVRIFGLENFDMKAIFLGEADDYFLDICWIIMSGVEPDPVPVAAGLTQESNMFGLFGMDDWVANQLFVDYRQGFQRAQRIGLAPPNGSTSVLVDPEATQAEQEDDAQSNSQSPSAFEGCRWRA